MVHVCLFLGGTTTSLLEANFSPHFAIEEPWHIYN